jgi:hypothetical protein
MENNNEKSYYDAKTTAEVIQNENIEERVSAKETIIQWFINLNAYGMETITFNFES